MYKNYIGMPLVLFLIFFLFLYTHVQVKSDNIQRYFIRCEDHRVSLNTDGIVERCTEMQYITDSRFVQFQWFNLFNCFFLDRVRHTVYCFFHKNFKGHFPEPILNTSLKNQKITSQKLNILMPVKRPTVPPGKV